MTYEEKYNKAFIISTEIHRFFKYEIIIVLNQIENKNQYQQQICKDYELSSTVHISFNNYEKIQIGGEFFDDKKGTSIIDIPIFSIPYPQVNCYYKINGSWASLSQKIII